MPYWSFQIDTPLPAPVVQERLRLLLRTKQETFWGAVEHSIDPPANEPPFHGNVAGHTFKISRVIRYRNSFLPVILGNIADRAYGVTTVRVRMRLPLFAMIFMAVWLGMVGSGIEWSFLLDLQAESSSTFLLFAMFLFGLVLPIVGFYPEAFKAERLLRNALKDGVRVVKR
jgi:hypothetical protein